MVMLAGDKAGCGNMLVHRRSNVDVSEVPRRAPVCSNLSQGLQQPLVELWQNWRGKVQTGPNLQPLWKQQKEDLPVIELFSSSTTLR